jgi:hypothetical protein
VHARVIDLLHPRLEGLVELVEARGRAVLELDQQLLANRAKRPLNLPATLRPPRPRMDQPDSEDRARPQQLAGDER